MVRFIRSLLAVLCVIMCLPVSGMAQGSCLTLPAELKRIEAEAFSHDQGITEVILPEGLTEIGEKAFADCSNLCDITVPESVISIAIDAFDNSQNVCILCKQNSVAHLYAKSRSIDYYLTNVAPDKPVVSAEYPDMPTQVGSIDGVDEATGDSLWDGIYVNIAGFNQMEECDGFYIYLSSDGGATTERIDGRSLTEESSNWYPVMRDFEPGSYNVWYTLYRIVEEREYESEPSVPGFFDVLEETTLEAELTEVEDESGLLNTAVHLSWKAVPNANRYEMIRTGTDGSELRFVFDPDFSESTDTDVVQGITYSYAIYPVSNNTSGSDWTWSRIAHAEIEIPTTIVPIHSLRVDGDSEVFGGGQTMQLRCEYAPAEHVNPQLTWMSSNPDIATVNSTGLVTTAARVAEDTDVTFTCIANDGSGLSASLTVNVKANRLYLGNNYNIYNASNTASYMNAWPDTMNGSWKSLFGTSSGDNSAEQMFALEAVSGQFDLYRLRVMEYGGLYVAATTSGAKIASLSESTVFKVVPAGEYVCFVTRDGQSALTLGSIVSSNYSHQRYVYLSKYSSSNTAQQWKLVTKSAALTTNLSTIQLNVGGTTKLTAYITSDGSENKPPLIYSTSNAEVATVTSAGVITAKGAGSAAITVKTVSGISKTIPITVVVPDLSKLPVIQFDSTAMSISENLAFMIPLSVSGYTGRFPVNMTVSEPTFDIVSTKFQNINQTLVQLGQSGVVFESGKTHSNTTEKPNSRDRRFYATGASMNLYVGGNYSGSKGNRTVTLTLNDSTDSSYIVGENRTLTVTLVDVDAKRPGSKGGYTRAEYVKACLPWLKDKYPSGYGWNHLIGAVNDDNCITTGTCSPIVHTDTNGILSGSWCNGSYALYQGSKICNGNLSYPSSQCMGFALKVASDVFGSTPMGGSGWTAYTSYENAGGFQPGDVVSNNAPHYFFVTGIRGDVVEVLHCNYGGQKCMIGRTGDPSWPDSCSTIDFWKNSGIQRIYRYTGW